MKEERPPIKHGDVYPVHVLRDEYGFNAENRPVIVVTKEEVPTHLQHLIPQVEKWAIPCDVTRGDYFEKEGESSVASFYYDVEPYTGEVDDWLDSQPKDVGDWPEAAVHFMYFMKAHGEAYQPTKEEIKEREEKFEKQRYQRAQKNSRKEALEAFKEKNYSRVVELLSPCKDALSSSESMKLKYSEKHLNK
ncbi:hypothetical protein IEN85_08195 [Pelagicoccus sp. NFK12]|uniref:Uncharacterized protein n=1 Tax=Pelagicoccus enzymogenes TaxID=2773457 RepID=A0A927IEV9_9BACT|nr:hypothetical protein [Pelagicoccus enzymogenes]MBD5779472.1 hypothetical protein [Pelagicoccus enzymogenes]